MPQPTKDLVRALAEANGLTIPEERVELVLRRYENLLRNLEAMNWLALVVKR